MAFEASWMKVFYHDSTGGVFFISEIEVKRSDSTNKYSILEQIDSKYLDNGKYEFLLEYPELTGYNRWKQTNNPVDEIEQEGKNASGYIPISISWSNIYWGGLVKSKVPETYIEGSSQSQIHAWYSIGCFSKQYSPQFPGPGIKVSRVILWVRIPDKSTKRIFSSTFNLVVLVFSSLLILV